MINMFYSLDDFIMSKFQWLSKWVNVTLAVNVSVVLNVIIEVFYPAINMGVSALSVLIIVAGSVICLNFRSKQKEGFKNELYEILRVFRFVFIFLTAIRFLLVPLDIHHARLLLELCAVYFVSTDKQPKPPKRVAIKRVSA